MERLVRLSFSSWVRGLILKGTGLPSSPGKRLEITTSTGSVLCTGFKNALRLFIGSSCQVPNCAGWSLKRLRISKSS